MNWGGSFITNDIYKQLIQPEAFNRRLAWVGKFANVGIVTLSFLIAFVPGQPHDGVVLVNQRSDGRVHSSPGLVAVFLVALEHLGRGRRSLTGPSFRLSSLVSAALLSEAVLAGLFVLFVARCAAILTTTCLTQPESMETLRRFYARCLLPGLWGPVAKTFGMENEQET